ncbi:MAG: hypothetical protein AAF253_05650 [Pseudomonadota bacterium]
MRGVVIVGVLAWLGVGTGLAQSCATQSIVWTAGGEAHGTAVLGRLRDGCPVLQQRRTREAGGTVFQLTGRDCDCDLVIDGMERLFRAPSPLAAKRLVAVCEANRALASTAPSSKAAGTG